MKAMLINTMSTIGVVTALGLLILSVAFFCNERGFHPLGKDAQRFRKLTWFEKLFFFAFVGVMTLFASIMVSPATIIFKNMIFHNGKGRRFTYDN